MSQRDDHAIRGDVMRFTTSSCRKIRVDLLKTRTDISTVLCHLSKEFGFKSYEPAAKSRLTFVMKKKRLPFANEYLHWPVEKWRTVLFFEESTVQQFAVRKRHVRRSKYQRFNAKYTVNTVKHLQARRQCTLKRATFSTHYPV